MDSARLSSTIWRLKERPWNSVSRSPTPASRSDSPVTNRKTRGDHRSASIGHGNASVRRVDRSTKCRGCPRRPLSVIVVRSLRVAWDRQIPHWPTRGFHYRQRPPRTSITGVGRSRKQAGRRRFARRRVCEAHSRAVLCPVSQPIARIIARPLCAPRLQHFAGYLAVCCHSGKMVDHAQWPMGMIRAVAVPVRKRQI